MARAETASAAARTPRGTKPVMQAFFTALESVPEASRSAVAKAAQAMIRDELKNRRDKMKAAAAKEKEKEKARKPAATAAKRAPKAAAAPEPAAPAPAPAKRRSRKQSDEPANPS